LKIGVILPSRGLIFSRTAEDILQNLKKVPHKIYFSHRKPIPDCFNEPLEKALADKDITHIWFVEDDMVIPPNTLWSMTLGDKAVVTADYPVNKKGRGSVFKVKDQIIFCGTGCLLVKREVFDELKKPYFRTDVRWRMKNGGDHIKMSSHKVEDDGYGLHDINFCMALYERGIPIHAIKPVLAQRKLLSLGKAGTNNGAHNIEIWKTVKKNELLNEIKSWPVEKSGKLVVVETEFGNMNVTEAHAKKLVKNGMAKMLPRKAVVVDWSGYHASPSVPDNL
jgi:hypothetical protein